MTKLSGFFYTDFNIFRQEGKIMLLKNGHLIDPATKTNEPVDIRVENGTIVELGKDLSAKDNEEVLDLSEVLHQEI